MRPPFLTVAVHLIPSVGWALIIGTVAADIVFYVLAATAFRATENAGLRGATDEPRAEDRAETVTAAS